MFKADYPDRQSLERMLEQAMKTPRQPVSLQLTTDETVSFKLQLMADNVASGTMIEAPHALITIDLDTLEVTIT